MSKKPPPLRLVDSFEDYPYGVDFFYTDHLDPYVLYESQRLLNQIALAADCPDYKIITQDHKIALYFKTDENREAFYRAFNETVKEQIAAHLFFGGSDQQRALLQTGKKTTDGDHPHPNYPEQ